MTIYMNRLFRKFNSSFLPSSGKSLKYEVSCIKDDLYLVDAGIGSSKMTMVDELRRVPNNSGFTRFENKVRFMDSTTGESLVKKQMLERFFMDLVTGEPTMKERVTARFSDMVGRTDAVAGELTILLP
ncbi:hypothetical protein L6452_05878 [Arctium lappa]|uniref:Uncharacterized protein n=1 Tax=Arctium lappa TaxID=4217 RepID=A0ACB9EH67_ARCLA|nr:hypothetical protein L6452_05878 [Arctium lappa]